MGYTHYWNIKHKKSELKKLEKNYQLAIKHCNTVIQYYNKTIKSIYEKHPDRLSGYSAHTTNYLGIHVNGTQNLSHEDFVLQPHLILNREFNFCKTAQKPYDVVVTACLLILKHYLKNYITLSSDGDSKDWIKGLDLAQKATKLKSLKSLPKELL